MTRRHAAAIAMLALQILIDGFAISALYALGATGFTLIFGVSGVLNLSHGAIMVRGGGGGLGRDQRAARRHLCSARCSGSRRALVAAFATYFVVVRPIQTLARASPRRRRRSSSSPARCSGAS